MRRYNRRKKQKKIFWWIYLGLVLILAAFVCLSVLTVKDLLTEYEQRQPDVQVKQAMAELSKKAENPDEFFELYGLSVPQLGEYEANVDIKAEFLALFSEAETEYAVKPGSVSEDEMGYVIRNNDLTLAQVNLKATGPLETKLAVFSMRDWEVSSVEVFLEARDYTLSLPQGFAVSVNGVALEESADGQYAVSGLYLEPEFTITDQNGNKAEYYISANGKVLADIYDYTLTLPKTLSVTLNGELLSGSENEEGYITYNITELEKPEVLITDLFGNKVSYEGGSIPLTATTILVKDGHKVTVDGKELPAEAVFEAVSPEYTFLSDIVEGLPMQRECNVAVLKKDAVISVSDESGMPLEIDISKSYNDLTLTREGSDAIPEEISASIDVLQVAKNWSLFMSNDMSFAQLSKYILEDSYQYEVAYKYSVSVDKTFFSGHSLLDPPFTDTSVGNFVMITEDSFSVDISLTKHMLLNSNQRVEDSMNDRFYFVKNNGSWLLVGMKEVTENAQ